MFDLKENVFLIRTVRTFLLILSHCLALESHIVLSVWHGVMHTVQKMKYLIYR